MKGTEMGEMEPAEHSAAKDMVYDTLYYMLEQEIDLDDAGLDLIGSADRIIEVLLAWDVLIPEWFPTFRDGAVRPAQGIRASKEDITRWLNLKEEFEYGN